MNFLLAIYLVIIASYTEQALSVPAVNSRAMIAKAKNGEHTFSFVFRHFAATKDLGGMYRLLWSVTAKPDDRQDVYQLLLANDDDSELAENSYPLLRKIIRNSSGRGQAAYIAKHIITDELHDAMDDLSDKMVAFYFASLEMGKNGSSVGEKLNEELAEAIDGFDEAHQNFSFVYLNVTQGSKQVGAWIRDYFNHQTKRIMKSILDKPLSEQALASITGRAAGGLIDDSLNILCILATDCRYHGHRDEQFLELTHSIGKLSSNVGISNIWL